MARATELPLGSGYGHLFADTMLNETPTKLVFDTGAEVTTITALAAARLELPLALSSFATGVGGSRSGYVFVARTFQIGRLHGHRLALHASDMAFSSGRSPVDGLLGADVLAAYDVDLDLPERKAILFRPLTSCSRPSAALSGDLYTTPMVSQISANDHRPFLHVQVGGKTLTALVDSGAPSTLIFATVHAGSAWISTRYKATGISRAAASVQTGWQP